MKITRCDRCDHDIEDGERALRLTLSDAMNTRAEALALDLCEGCAEHVRKATRKHERKFICEATFGWRMCQLDDGHDGNHLHGSVPWTNSQALTEEAVA